MADFARWLDAVSNVPVDIDVECPPVDGTYFLIDWRDMCVSEIGRLESEFDGHFAADQFCVLIPNSVTPAQAAKVLMQMVALIEPFQTVDELLRSTGVPALDALVKAAREGARG